MNRQRITLGLLGALALAMMAFAALCVSVAAACAALGASCFGISAWLFVRRHLVQREATAQGRTQGRTLGLFWAARRCLGRAFAREPLYLVMGAQGVGKTSFLQAAMDQDSRAIDAASAPEAQPRLVSSNARHFLEVPGRLIQSTDLAAWKSFLRTLYWLGAARRLKGIVWMTDISAVGGADAAPMALEALDAIVQVLGVRPPTYLILHRCDDVPGFTETFATAAPKTRQGPWGFAIDDQDETALVSGHRFDALMDTLRGYTMAHLSSTDSRAARAPLYLFPQYVSTLRRGLMHCVERTFGTQARPCAPRMGGIYLTAVPPQNPDPAQDWPTGPKALQSDTATAPSAAVLWQAESLTQGPEVLTTLAQDARLVPNVTCQDAFFVEGFIDNVLAHDAALSTHVSQPGLRGAARRARGHVAAGICVMVVMGLCVASFATAGARVNALSAVVSQPWQQQDGDAQDGLARLAHILEQNDDGFVARWGARTGFETAATRAPLEQLFVRILQRELIAPLLAADAAGLQAVWRRHAYAGTAPTAEEATAAAAQLRMHLLLTGPKAAHEAAPNGRQGLWLRRALTSRLIEARSGDDDEVLEQVDRHLRLYVGLIGSQPGHLLGRDQALVSRVRALLQRRPLPDLLIDAVTHDVSLFDPALRLDDIVATAGLPLISRNDVPAAFTRQGYEGHVRAWLNAQDTDGDAWIFWEKPPPLAKRRQAVQLLKSRYFNRYIEVWRAFLDGLSWQEPREAHGGQAMLVALTQSEPPPLRALWRAVAANTDLGVDGPAGAAEGVLSGLRRRLVSGPVQEGENQQRGPARGPNDVAAYFRAFLAFAGSQRRVDAELEGKASLTAYQELLQALRGATDSYLDAPQETGALMQQLRRARCQAAGLIQTAQPSPGSRALLQQLLLVPLDQLTRGLTRGAKAQVHDMWCPAVVQPFAQLAGQYPFDAFGPDAAPEDVAAFFHPDHGQPWRFYQEHLKEDVLRRVNTFHFDEKLGGVLKRTYRGELLGYYDHLLAASHALFSGNASDVMAADFDVRLTMDQDLWETRVLLEGITLEVAPGHKASDWRRVHWPAAQPGAQRASLNMVGVGGIKERLDFDGAWSFWHLIESGAVRIDKTTGIITVMWRPGGLMGHARLEIRPLKANNIFYVGRGQSMQGGVFAYLRGRALAPPRAIGVGQKPCY